MMILFSWMEIYHMSRALKLIDRNKRKRRIVTKPLIGIVVSAAIVAQAVVAISVAVMLIPGASYDLVSTLQAVVILIFTLTGTVLISVYYCLLCRQYRKVSSFNSSLIKRSQLKCTFLALLYFTFLLLRVAYIQSLNNLMRSLLKRKIISDNVFSITWFAYFVVTEQAPILLVLFITRTFATVESLNKLRRRRNQEGQRERRLDRMQREMIGHGDAYGVSDLDGSRYILDDVLSRFNEKRCDALHEGYWAKDNIATLDTNTNGTEDEPGRVTADVRESQLYTPAPLTLSGNDLAENDGAIALDEVEDETAPLFKSPISEEYHNDDDDDDDDEVFL